MVRRVRLPRGTSDYQAAWILDDDDEDGVATDSEDGDEAGRAPAAPRTAAGAAGEGEGMEASDEAWDPEDGTATDADDMMVHR